MSLSSVADALKPSKFTDEDLIEHCKKANQNILDTYSTTRRRWDDAHATYNNQFDFSDKAPWQSKNFVPKFQMAVRTTRALMKQSLIKADRFFAFEGLNEKVRDVEKDIEDALYRILDQAEFKQRQFSRAVFLGLLENLMIFKVYPVPLESHEEPIDSKQEFKIKIVPISAYDLRIDPRNRGRMLIHHTKMDLADYRALVKQGVYTKDSLEYVTEDFSKADDELKERLRNNEPDLPRPEFRKEVDLLEYWGDVDDNKGNRIHENVTFTVVNEKALARHPIENPFRHKQPPFIFGPIIERFGSTYHEGFGDGVIGLARMMNEMWNVSIDAASAASADAHEVNLDYVHNPSELKSGIYSGKVIKTRGVPPGASAVTNIQLGRISPENLQVIASLDREFQNGTGVNEFISGMVGVGDKTATEVKQKAGQSIGFMQAVAEEIEDNVLEPLIEMVYSLTLQYNPELFGDRVNSLPIQDLRFLKKAKALSKVLSQVENMQQLFMWINMVAKTPIASKINWDAIAQDSLHYLNLDPRRILISEQIQPPQVGQGPTNPDLEQAQAQEQNLGKVVQLNNALGGQG